MIGSKWRVAVVTSVLVALMVPVMCFSQQTRPTVPPGLEKIQVQKTIDAELSGALESRRETTAIEAQEGGFRRAFLRALVEARQEGKISRGDALKLRVRSFSPAFMGYVEDLAVTQLAFSGVESEHVPLSEDGSIQRTAINWEGLLKFIEALLPLILQLIDALSYVEPAVEMLYASVGSGIPAAECPAGLAA